MCYEEDVAVLRPMHHLPVRYVNRVVSTLRQGYEAVCKVFFKINESLTLLVTFNMRTDDGLQTRDELEVWAL